MQRTAVRTGPASYSKICDTSRPRQRKASARRTDLGTVSFVSFDIHRLPSGSFVPQHVPERRPTSVQDGLSHLGFRKLGRAHVADNDQTIFTSNPRGFHMKVVT